MERHSQYDECAKFCLGLWKLDRKLRAMCVLPCVISGVLYLIPAQALGSVLLCRTDYKSQSRYGETESSVVLQV